MSTRRKITLNKLTLETRGIFLLDGFGALLTAFMVEAVLACFDDKFGLEPKTLYELAAVALLYADYSVSCYYLAGINWRVCLTLLGAANLLYGLVTAAITVLNYGRLTRLGLTYFVLELSSLTLLIVIEFSTLAGSNPQVCCQHLTALLTVKEPVLIPLSPYSTTVLF